jgi:mannose-1-phosphate guanylyltransferase / mannose-6-phosphate isomerase
LRADFPTLEAAGIWFRAWLTDDALPLWSTLGMDPSGFHEAIGRDGRPTAADRRARVQARQVHVYATAALAGLGAGWGKIAEGAFVRFAERYRRDDGLVVNLVSPGGAVVDDTAFLYEQAFALLAMSTMARLGSDAARAWAEKCRTGLERFRHPEQGFVEAGAHPHQANAQMHLLESALAWEPLGGAAWTALSDEIAALALGRLIDLETGAVREFFRPDWSPATGDLGRHTEPGHQFEWATLLRTWAERRGSARGLTAARRLYGAGLSGIDSTRSVAVNVKWIEGDVADFSARLWPQTEWLRAALSFGDDVQALAAARTLARYLDVTPKGAWRDRMNADGGFVDEPSPASSFYHIAGAILPLIARRG